MQYQLLIHMAFSIEKSGEFNRTVRLKSGNSQSQLSQCYCKHIKYYLSSHTGFLLSRYMLYCKFDNGNTGRRVAQNAQFGNFSTNNCLITFQLLQSTQRRWLLPAYHQTPQRLHPQCASLRHLIFPLAASWMMVL